MKEVPLVLVVVLVTQSIFAIAPSTAQTAQSSSATDEEVIRALEDRVRLGVLNQDIASLTPLWSEDFMVNAPANRVSPNRRFVFDLIEAGLIHYTSFETSIEALRIDGDVAIVMGAETVMPTGKAPLAGATVQRRYTHIWKRDGETWLLIARHANIRPPE